MNLLELVAGPILKIIDKVIPDPAAKAAAQLEVLRLQQSGELAQLEADLKMAVGQMEINKVEASNSSLFVAGWRPAVGWICGGGFGFQFVVGPLLEWAATVAGHPAKFPTLDTMPMIAMLSGMLGLGGMRTWEKLQGVSGRS